MMKKILALTISMLAILSLTACGKKAETYSDEAGLPVFVPAVINSGSSSPDKAAAIASTAASQTEEGTTVLRLAFNQSEDHPQYQALAEMSDKFYDATNGAYRIEISPNELLGSQKDAFELVKGGIVQMAIIGNAIAESANSDFAVIGLPFVYDSLDHQKKVLTSGILDDLFNTTSSSNFNVLTAFTSGSRCVYTDKPIEKPEDLNNHKIRVMESDTMKKMMGYMGGIGVPMAQGEVYGAIQQGTIDGGENSEITYADLRHYEVAPYFSYTKHLMVPDLLIINSELLNQMSASDRETLKNLSREATLREYTLWDEKVEPAKKAAIDGGATFVDVDITPFQENCKPLVEEITSGSAVAADIYNKIRKMAP